MLGAALTDTFRRDGHGLAASASIMAIPIKEQINDALAELETVTDEIRVRLHLAGMDANDVWSMELEPRLLEARKHAHEATIASKAAIKDTIAAFRGFQSRL